MITINIGDTISTDNPNDVLRKRSSVDIFVEGFAKLCSATGMTQIMHKQPPFMSFNMITQLLFENGESIGINRLFKEIGFKNI